MLVEKELIDLLVLLWDLMLDWLRTFLLHCNHMGSITWAEHHWNTQNEKREHGVDIFHNMHHRNWD